VALARCTKPRDISEEDLAKGASMVGAITISGTIAQGACPIAFV
jgi:hypothetical protein